VDPERWGPGEEVTEGPVTIGVVTPWVPSIADLDWTSRDSQRVRDALHAQESTASVRVYVGSFGCFPAWGGRWLLNRPGFAGDPRV